MTRAQLPDEPTAKADVLQQFAGCWVGVWEGVVVAAARTLDELYAILDNEKLPDAIVFRVPDPKQGVFVGAA